VETMLELLSSGMSMEEILADYSDLERDDLIMAFCHPANFATSKATN
jgi:uncharacterized protein (DUF433 family)